jgi:transposase
VICIDARHANRVLSMRRNKTDRNDAHGLAELMRLGWYKEARVRDLDAQRIRSMLNARYQLRMCRRDILNQLRGILKTFGLFTGSTATRRFPEQVREIIRDQPDAAPMLAPLLVAHDAVLQQIDAYETGLRAAARADPTARRLMTVPGDRTHEPIGIESGRDDRTR